MIFIWGQGVQTRIKSPYRWSAEVRFLTGRDGIGWTGRIGRFFITFFSSSFIRLQHRLGSTVLLLPPCFGLERLVMGFVFVLGFGSVWDWVKLILRGCTMYEKSGADLEVLADLPVNVRWKIPGAHV